MKIKLLKYLFLVFLIFVSCGDDDDNGIIQVPEADRDEQQVIDNDSLLGYFQTHYINQSQLIGNLNIGLDEIISTSFQMMVNYRIHLKTFYSQI